MHNIPSHLKGNRVHSPLIQILTGFPLGSSLKPFLQANVILSPVMYVRLKLSGFLMYVENGMFGKVHILTGKEEKNLSEQSEYLVNGLDFS